jgi:hypothetical protein
MAEAVRHRPLTAETLVTTRVNPCGLFCEQKKTLRQVFLPVIQFPC